MPATLNFIAASGVDFPITKKSTVNLPLVFVHFFLLNQRHYCQFPLKIIPKTGVLLSKREFHLQNGILGYKIGNSFSKRDSRYTNGTFVFQLTFIENIFIKL